MEYEVVAEKKQDQLHATEEFALRARCGDEINRNWEVR